MHSYHTVLAATSVNSVCANVAHVCCFSVGVLVLVFVECMYCCLHYKLAAFTAETIICPNFRKGFSRRFHLRNPTPLVAEYGVAGKAADREFHGCKIGICVYQYMFILFFLQLYTNWLPFSRLPFGRLPFGSYR